MGRPGQRPAWLSEQHREATRPLPVEAPAGSLGPARTHCWVLGPPDAPGPWPALVVQWHHGEQGWVAQVVYVVDEGGPVMVTAWLAATQLRPA